MGYGILLLMRIILAAAAAANHSSCTASTNAAATGATCTSTSTATGIAAAHARTGIIIESLAHLAIPIVSSADTELGEKPDTSAIEQITAEVHEEGEDDGTCRHNDGFARLGPVHHGVDGSLIFPIAIQVIIGS